MKELSTLPHFLKLSILILFLFQLCTVICSYMMLIAWSIFKSFMLNSNMKTILNDSLNDFYQPEMCRTWTMDHIVWSIWYRPYDMVDMIWAMSKGQYDMIYSTTPRVNPLIINSVWWNSPWIWRLGVLECAIPFTIWFNSIKLTSYLVKTTHLAFPAPFSSFYKHDLNLTPLCLAEWAVEWNLW